MGEFPKINVDRKNKTIEFAGNKLKVINLASGQVSLNGYPLNLIKERSIKETYKYLERVLRKTQFSFKNFILPRAHAGNSGANTYVGLSFAQWFSFFSEPVSALKKNRSYSKDRKKEHSLEEMSCNDHGPTLSLSSSAGIETTSWQLDEELYKSR